MRVNGPRIRELREDLGMNARDLCKEASISPSHLSLIENNIRNPGPHAVARIAKALGVAIVDLRE